MGCAGDCVAGRDVHVEDAEGAQRVKVGLTGSVSGGAM
jgi:hypothetical protein